MGSQRPVNIDFPAGGLDKRLSYQNQRPFTTPFALNARTNDVFEGRARGGSRPGTRKLLNVFLGDHPIRMLAQLEVVPTPGRSRASWLEDFDNDQWFSGGEWRSPVNERHPSQVPAIPSWLTPSFVYGIQGSINPDLVNFAANAIREGMDTVDPTVSHRISVSIVPTLSNEYKGTMYVYARLHNVDPNPDLNAPSGRGIVLQISVNTHLSGNPGEEQVRATIHEIGHAPGLPGNSVHTTLGFIQDERDIVVDLEIGAEDPSAPTGVVIKAFWNQRPIGELTTTAAGAGTTAGFGLVAESLDDVLEDAILVDSMQCAYTVEGSGVEHVTSQRNMLIASSNGILHVQDETGVFFPAISSLYDLSADRNLQAAGHLQKLYIADYNEADASGSDGVIGGDDGDQLSAPGSIPDWRERDVTAGSDVCVITNHTDPTADNTYGIVSVSEDFIVLDTEGVDISTGSTNYSIEKPPKVYIPDTNTIENWTEDTENGSMPIGNPLITVWRDRVVLAGAKSAPQSWIMSRQGDAHDFDTGQPDADVHRAMAGDTSEAGIVGEPITALIPHSDDYLLVGTRSSLSLFRGDPAVGGQLDNLSRTVGVVGAQAWCHTPTGDVVFLSRDGIYGLTPGSTAYPISMSREKLPNDLLNITDSATTAFMAYDVRGRGIHIFLYRFSALAILPGRHYWLDWETKGIWPFTSPSIYGPSAVLQYNADTASEAAVLMGCKDGHIRRFDKDVSTDDGFPFTSTVFIGPLKLGTDHNEGILAELVGVLGEGSGPVTWEVRAGDTAESAYGGQVLASGTWSAGRNLAVHPRVRGHSIFLVITGDPSTSWALERISAIYEQGGRQRAL